ncbi:MAG TPA: DNA primase [Candidatus Eremiobacteraceae bacterium]|nr:DNA primase [Candidatus Eremiobacteraceae bacterium]
MPFDAGVVAEIQAKVDLLAYVSQYVTLKKRGREYLGLCPFHAEKTPSFSLNAEKQLWHCYGCDAGGDLIKFVQRYENVDFQTALRMLAQRAGVELRESKSEGRRRSEREAIYEANSVAAGYFASELKKSRAALDYLKNRGIAIETAEKFGIGFAPDSWDGFVAAARKSGIDLELAARAGLVRARPQSDGFYDFFRNRLMLPTHNLTGEVMAFGGRALGDETPKYINTPSTAAYTKGHHVYALNIARRAAAADGALIVVEGYLDAIALHQAGFANAVASLGTSFTLEQARELRRVAPNVYLSFDGDKAGVAATTRSIDMLVDEGLTVEVVALPAGKDPDEIVRTEGAPRFRALLDASVPWKDFKLELAFRQAAAAKFVNPSDIAREVMKVVVQERDPIVRDRYVKTISRKLDISESALRRIERGEPSAPRVMGQRPSRRPFEQIRAPSAERELVQLLIVRPALVERAASQISAEEFDDAVMADAYRHLSANRARLVEGMNPLTLFVDDEVGADLSRLALASPPLTIEEDEQRFDRLIERFDRKRMERRLSTIDAELNGLLTRGLPVPDVLRDEYNSLAASLRGSRQNGKEE